MPNIHWRKVTKLAAKEFACFLMATDDKSRTITLEAMLGCRNPEQEPVDRIYFGWHASYTMPDETLQQTALFSGSCGELGQWVSDDLSEDESSIINNHINDVLVQWQQKLTQAEVACELEQLTPAANSN